MKLRVAATARSPSHRWLALLAAVTWIGVSGRTAAESSPPAPVCGQRCVLVNAVRVELRTYAAKVSLTGGIEPKFTSNVAFRIAGKIDKRLVEIGEHVKADQVLARLDPKDQQASLDAAKAGLVSSEAALTQAKANYDRQSELYRQGYGTRPAYDQAEQQLRTQTAAVASAKAAVGSAEEQLGYIDLKAGVAGIITGRNAEAGQVVAPGQTVFTLAQDEGRDAVFDLYEALLAQPPADRKIDIYLQSNPTVATTGHVREISPTVDQASGTVKVKVGLDRVPAQMSLGAAVVGIGAFRPQEAVVLPRGALYRWHNAPAVWTVDPTTRAVNPKTVTVLRYTGDAMVLSGGITPGEMVVTAGSQFLYPGQIVGIANAERPR